MPILTILTSVVSSSQVLFLTQTKTYDLGEFDKQWRDVYAGGSLYGYESLLVLQVLQLHMLLLLLLRLTNHRYNGSGSSSGYFIDGSESPILTLLPGKTYRFTNDNKREVIPSSLYLESDKTTEYTANVTTTGTPE